ncbi:MAG: hypothetical protein IPJ41_01565 [Phycisphaerales bacterium]|nr:hypothetical protein [Phycisphaerales bacterium]
MVIRTAATVLALAAAAAEADIVDMYYSGPGRGRNAQITMGNVTEGVFAGQLLHQVSTAQGRGEALLGATPMFCTDVFQDVAWQQTAFTLTRLIEVPDSQPMSPRTAGAVRDLFAAANGAQLDLNGSNDFAAAFQLAVWEVVNDYDWHAGRASLNLSEGWFRAANLDGSALSGTVLSSVESLFDSVGSGSSYAGLVALRSPTAQDQLAVVPSPGAATALAGAALALIARRRR